MLVDTKGIIVRSVSEISVFDMFWFSLSVCCMIVLFNVCVKLVLFLRSVFSENQCILQKVNTKRMVGLGSQDNNLHKLQIKTLTLKLKSLIKLLLTKPYLNHKVTKPMLTTLQVLIFSFFQNIV